jgi:hypothetical protein
MLSSTRDLCVIFGSVVAAFVGVNNAAMVPAARTYVQVAVILPSCICNAENASQVDCCSLGDSTTAASTIPSFVWLSTMITHLRLDDE